MVTRETEKEKKEGTNIHQAQASNSLSVQNVIDQLTLIKERVSEMKELESEREIWKIWQRTIWCIRSSKHKIQECMCWNLRYFRLMFMFTCFLFCCYPLTFISLAINHKFSMSNGLKNSPYVSLPLYVYLGKNMGFSFKLYYYCYYISKAIEHKRCHGILLSF